MKDLISRTEAIKALGDEGLITAMIIVSKVPDAQPTQNNDYNALKSVDCIDRQAAIEIVDDINTWTGGWRYYAIEKIRSLPSAQPERKTGKWVWFPEISAYSCSECHRYQYGNTLEVMSGDYHYCPACGAEMEVKE